MINDIVSLIRDEFRILIKIVGMEEEVSRKLLDFYGLVCFCHCIRQSGNCMIRKFIIRLWNWGCLSAYFNQIVYEMVVRIGLV